MKDATWDIPESEDLSEDPYRLDRKVKGLLEEMRNEGFEEMADEISGLLTDMANGYFLMAVHALNKLIKDEIEIPF